MIKFKKMIALLSAVSILSTLVVTSSVSAGTVFSDVDDSAYYGSAVNLLAEAEIVTKNPTFRPNDNIARSEGAKLAVKGSGTAEASPSTPKFFDVKKTDWFYTVVEGAAAAGVVGGYRDTAGKDTGYFGPGDMITRAQAAKIFTLAFNIDIPSTVASNPFPDVNKDEWFAPYIQAGVENKLINGYQNGNFGPNDPIVRGAFALITCRAMVMAGTLEGNCDAVAPPAEGGDLMVELSDNTPDGGKVPGGIQNAEVAVFSFTAGDEDVLLTSLQFLRAGFSSDESLKSIALFDENGFRLSNSKSFNSSDDVASVNLLSGGYTIPAGETVEITLLGEVGTANAPDNAAGDSFAVSLQSATSVISNAVATDGDFPIVSNEMEVASVDAGTLVITNGPTTPDVSVGQQNVEIAALEFEADSIENRDIEFYGVTFKQEGSADEVTEMMNYRLYIDGVQQAMVEEGRDDYVALMLPEPFMINDGDNVDVTINADIVGGPGEDIIMDIDTELDVRAKDAGYGFGAIIDLSGYTAATNTVEIEAGDVTIVAVNTEYDTIQDDKDNVVLGTLKVSANSGENLEIQEASFRFVDAGGNILDGVFENVELYVTGGATYDLDPNGTGDADGRYESDTLDIAIPAGKTVEIQLRADTLEDDNWLSDLELSISLDAITGAPGSDFFVVETDDDTAVTDITPSSLSFNTFTGSSSDIIASTVTQSATKTAVVGSKDVPALAFELEAGDASAASVYEFTLSANTTLDAVPLLANVFSSSRISKVSLYKNTVAPENLIVSKSGSQITSGGQLTLDFKGSATTVLGNKVVIEPQKTVNFIVTVDIVDATSNANDEFRLQLVDVKADDSDNDPVDTAGLNVVSSRNMVITGTGTLNVAVDNTDGATNKAKMVLGGETDLAKLPTVASFELTALNEPIKIKDLTLTEDTGIGFEDYVSQVVLLKSDKTTVIATKSVVPGDDVVFNNLNYEVAQGSENIYVKVIGHKFGESQAGLATAIPGDDMFLNLTVDSAVSASTGKAISGGGVGVTTGNSLGFAVEPVRLSGISFVNSAMGQNISTKLNDGLNTIAIVKVDNADHMNTNTLTSTALKTQLLEMNFEFSQFGGTTINDTQIQRLGGSGQKLTDVSAFNFNLRNFTEVSDYEIDKGETAYFAILVDVTTDPVSDVDDFVDIDFNSLNAGNFVYSFDNTVSLLDDLIPEVRLFDTLTLDGPKLTQ